MHSLALANLAGLDPATLALAVQQHQQQQHQQQQQQQHTHHQQQQHQQPQQTSSSEADVQLALQRLMGFANGGRDTSATEALNMLARGLPRGGGGNNDDHTCGSSDRT
jgi:hypothetical protein